MISVMSCCALPDLTGDLQQLPQKLQAAWVRALQVAVCLAQEAALAAALESAMHTALQEPVEWCLRRSSVGIGRQGMHHKSQ